MEQTIEPKTEVKYSEPVGPNNYRGCGKALLKKGIIIPTARQTASHLREAYDSEDFQNTPEAEKLRDIMIQRWLWVFNRQGWMPRNADNAGVYIIHDSNAVGLSENFNIEEAEDLLSSGATEQGVRFSQNRLTRFVPYSAFREIKTHDDLAEDGFTRGSYDFDGAEDLAQVSRKHISNPAVYRYDNRGNELVQSVVRLYSCVGRLHVDGLWGGRLGFAFGVLPTGEASAQKISPQRSELYTPAQIRIALKRAGFPGATDSLLKHLRE